jgi:uncharacterized protein (TIGR00661 family)
MNGENINKPGDGLRILIAPLDWGLGHATRCIPIIYALISAGAGVIIAGNNTQEAILKKEFPQLPFLSLNGYNIQYGKNKRTFLLKLLSQFPAIKNTLQYEHNWLKKVVREYKIDAVISDNRFGLFHTNIPTVYITHQLHIETGKKWINKIAQQIHYHYINRFTQCWVPDAEGDINLAGKLSHPKKMPLIPVKYLGTLSRFKKQERPITNYLLIILSGPEPQRSIFENILLQQLKDFEASVVLVRGLPAQSSTITLTQNIKVFNHLVADHLSNYIQQSAIVLTRAGYSSVMDLATLKQKAVLVPTPGQTEQEYLAALLKKQQLFYSCSQHKFNLQNALNEAKEFYKMLPVSPPAFNESIIFSWLEEIQKIKVLQ